MTNKERAEFIAGLQAAYDAIMALGFYRSTIGDRAYENGSNDGRDKAAETVRLLIESARHVPSDYLIVTRRDAEHALSAAKLAGGWTERAKQGDPVAKKTEAAHELEARSLLTLS